MGAGLSILDMATDIVVIVGYMGRVKTKGYGWSLLGEHGAAVVLGVCAEQGEAAGDGQRDADRIDGPKTGL